MLVLGLVAGLGLLALLAHSGNGSDNDSNSDQNDSSSDSQTQTTTSVIPTQTTSVRNYTTSNSQFQTGSPSPPQHVSELAILRSKTDCSFVNDRITIDFSTGAENNETLQEKYSDLDLDKQQIYIYKPSELFKKGVDAIVIKQSRARGNLHCSYELFDECYTSYGLSDECFNTSDSFACKFDAKKMHDGLIKSDDYTPYFWYNSRMELDYTTESHRGIGSFQRNFNVSESPGTYCVNVTTYKNFDKPLIGFWDRTPFSKKHPKLPLPVYDYASWLGIASVSLLLFGLYNLLYGGQLSVAVVIGCLLKNAFEIIAIFLKADDVPIVAHVIVTGICGTIISTIYLSVVVICVSEVDKSFLIFSPYVFTKVYYFIVMCIQRFREPCGYFTIGSIMNNLVFYMHDDQVLFYFTLALNIIAWIISLCIAIEVPSNSRRKAVDHVLLATLYFVICLIIETSFLARKSQFLDTFHKDPLVIIYSRLDEILVGSYICGKILWRMFGKHYKFYDSISKPSK